MSVVVPITCGRLAEALHPVAQESVEQDPAESGGSLFSAHHLRHTFASRLSAGGVSDRFVTLLLRQDDATVFKRYSHADLRMKRDALAKLEAQEPDPRLEDLGTRILN